MKQREANSKQLRSEIQVIYQALQQQQRTATAHTDLQAGQRVMDLGRHEVE